MCTYFVKLDVLLTVPRLNSLHFKSEKLLIANIKGEIVLKPFKTHHYINLTKCNTCATVRQQEIQKDVRQYLILLMFSLAT